LLVVSVRTCPAVAEEDLVGRALKMTPTALFDCEEVPFPELATWCRMDVGRQAATAGDLVGVLEACRSIVEPLWKDECHYVAAEVLGEAGDIAGAFSLCTDSGVFVDLCTNNVSWAKRAPLDVRALGTVRAETLVDDFVRTALRNLQAVPPKTKEIAATNLRVSAWFDIYYGSGEADPVHLENLSSDDAVPARTAFAAEVIRLLGTGIGGADPVRTVLGVWRGDAAVPRGTPLAREHWSVRVANLDFDPFGTHLQTPVFLSSARFVADDATEDLGIAALEAAFLQQPTPAAAFAPWLEDERERVRWTAAKLFALSGGSVRELRPSPRLDRRAETIIAAADERLVICWGAPSGCR